MAYFIKTDLSRAIAIVWDNSRKLCKTIIGHAFFDQNEYLEWAAFMYLVYKFARNWNTLGKNSVAL